MKNSSEHHPDFDSAGAADSGAERTVLDWPRHAGLIDQLLPAIESRVRRRRQRRLGAVGAGLVALLVVGLMWPGWQKEQIVSAPEVAASPLVLPMTQVLSDGSVVQLREGAEIAVAFDENQRRVILKKGEAHFQVTKNARRPFIVVAGGIEARAVGTAFAVQFGGQAVEVLVTEGRVAVDHETPESDEDPPTPAPLAILNAGYRVTIETKPDLPTKPEVTAVSTEEMQERLAWRIPRLDLSGTPLDEVITHFNTYGSARFTLADPALGQLRISGMLRVDHPELLVRLCERNLGIRAERRNGNEVVLFRSK